TNFPNEGTCGNPSDPTSTVEDSNSLTIDFGDYNCDGARDSVIEVLVTATVQDVKLADGFIINNRMINGENGLSTATANRLLTFTRPDLNITKGVVEVGGNSSVEHDLELEPPSNGNDGTKVTTGDNRDEFDNEGIDGVDAGDTITYAIIIENTSQSSNKAHGIRLVDDLLDADDGVQFVDGSLNAWLGSGEALDFGEADLFDEDTGLTFLLDDDPLELDGVDAQGENDAGTNIIVVTYEAQLGRVASNSEQIDAMDVPYGYEHTNTAKVKEYYATEDKDGENLGPVEDDATIRVTADQPVKFLVDTSEE